jgi:hypothetical protein
VSLVYCSSPANWAAAVSELPRSVNPVRVLPRSTSISLRPIPKQSNPARSTSLSSQSARAAAESSSAFCLLSAYAAGTIVVIAVVVNNVPATRKTIAKIVVLFI